MAKVNNSIASEGSEDPIGLPPRADHIKTLLQGTARGGVPIRGVFIQKKDYDEKGTRGGKLASLTTDPKALDAYLVIHAMASSTEPYTTEHSALAWAHATGFTEHATQKSACQRWSKAVAKLSKLGRVPWGGVIPGARVSS